MQLRRQLGVSAGPQTAHALVPQIILCGGSRLRHIAGALRQHTPHVDLFADYWAGGLIVRTGYADRLIDLTEREEGALARELALLGLPQYPEDGAFFRNPAPGAVYVFDLDLDLSAQQRLRHRLQDWSFVLHPPGLDLASFYHADEDALHRLLEKGGPGGALPPAQCDRVLAVKRRLNQAYVLLDPPTPEDVDEQMRYLAALIPAGSRLLILLTDPAFTSPEARMAHAAYLRRMARIAAELPFVATLALPGATTDQPHGSADPAALSDAAGAILATAHATPPRATQAASRRYLRRILEHRRRQADIVNLLASCVKASAEAIAGAPPDPDDALRAARAVAAGEISLAAHLRTLLKTAGPADELPDRPPAGTGFAGAAPPAGQPVAATLLDPLTLRVPDDLRVTRLTPKRILIVGSCLSNGMATCFRNLPDNCEVDLYFTGVDLPPAPARPIADYDFQIVQPPLRFVMPDRVFARLAHADLKEHRRSFDLAVAVLHRTLDSALKWNREHGLLTFVFPFPTPTQNPAGRLLPRFDLRNAVHFVEKLNQALADYIERQTNVYYFELNEIFAYFGKRFIQDDVLTAINHGSYMINLQTQWDAPRLEPMRRASDFIEVRDREFFTATWHELVGAWRTIRQVDQVKLVVVDLDDTLWRGVIGELDLENLPTADGWPIGLWEALLLLKRRGILLAIISKNDEERVLEAWDKVFRKRLLLSDFVAREINWFPKAENLGKILQAINLLPKNVLYIDDNPVERAALQAAYPDLRVMGGSPLLWRRVLLWAPETQCAAITAESSARTDMVRAQAHREALRENLGRDDFLASLGVSVALIDIGTVEHPRFARALELVNKTNQFNTTGRRWTLEECKAHFAAGHAMIAFEVSDRYTEYGLVGVFILEEAAIVQFVLSCRVLGLGVEAAALAALGDALIAAGADAISARLIETERNHPCRGVYAQSGFIAEGETWRCAAANWRPAPPHVAISRAPVMASRTREPA